MQRLKELLKKSLSEQGIKPYILSLLTEPCLLFSGTKKVKGLGVGKIKAALKNTAPQYQGFQDGRFMALIDDLGLKSDWGTCSGGAGEWIVYQG